jgi:class 3 adenylate cyclase
MVCFWGLLGLCGVLTVVCTSLALRELPQPWSGFGLNHMGFIQFSTDTAFANFDQVIAVQGQPVHGGADVRALIQRLPPGSPVTYRILRGQQTREVTAPVQVRTWKRLFMGFGIPLLVALGQLCLGAVVFLLRPNMPHSWVFLGFGMTWFGLFITLFDFFSTYVFAHLLCGCWCLTSALFVHLALVFPEERPCVRRSPRLPFLLYLPSLLMWGVIELCLFGALDLWFWRLCVRIYAVYWGATLLVLLASLTQTLWRVPSPVARHRAATVLFGFAAGFMLPMGGQIVAMIFRLPLPILWGWPLTLLLPLSIAYAILRYNLFDVGMIVRHSLTYGVLTGLVTMLYLASIWLSDLLLQGVSLAQSDGFPVVFGFVVLLGFNPLRARLQQGLDRLFFRTRYDFRQTIETLSRDLTVLLDLDEIAGRILTTVLETLQVTRVACYLADGHGAYEPVQAMRAGGEHLVCVRLELDNPVVALLMQQRHAISRYDLEADPELAQQTPDAAAAFRHLGSSLALPMLFKDDVIGLLVLGEKRSGAIFTAADLELLHTLTHQSAVAMANAWAYRALEETNRALRTALRKVELLEHMKLHLGKFVPATVRQIVERDPTAPALDKHDQDVTVLFLDIAGYTSLSEMLDKERMNALVERYFSSFLDDIYANRGDINETAGDGLMIIFQDDDPWAHARAAVRTALAIRAQTQRINTELAGVYAPVAVNIGINSGLAAVGATRFQSATGTRWTFTASGPVTNLAARLAARATQGAIYVGPETIRRLGPELRLRALGLQALKNVHAPVMVYEVLEQPTEGAGLKPTSLAPGAK